MRNSIALVLFAACSPATSRTQQAIDSQATFFHTGYGAGPALFTDATGAVIEEHRYEPFGVPIEAGAIDLNAMNKRTEPSTGWSDHGARWLAPEIARWLSTDPPVEGPRAAFMAAPWALHPYQYVDANPIAYWDPDGRQPAPAVLQVDYPENHRCPKEPDPPPSGDVTYGRPPVTDGKPNVGYSYLTLSPNGPDHGGGIAFGFGLLNAPVTGANFAMGRVDGGIGQWTDPATGTVNYGVGGQGDVLKFSVEPGRHGVGIEAGAGNGDVGAYANKSDATVGATAYLVDGAVTIGNQHHSVRAGLNLGAGASARVHYGDSDGNGYREWGWGVDFEFFEFDFKTEAPGRAYDAVFGKELGPVFEKAKQGGGQ